MNKAAEYNSITDLLTYAKLENEIVQVKNEEAGEPVIH